MKLLRKKINFFIILASGIFLLLSVFSLCGCSVDINLKNDSSDRSAEKSSQKSELSSTASQHKIEEVKTLYGYDNISDLVSKQIYDKIADVSQNVEGEVINFDGDISEKQIYEAIEAYKNDHPEVFWIKSGYKYYKINSTTHIELYYTMTGDELVSAKSRLESKLDSIVKAAPKNAGVYEYELYANNYIIDNCVYDDTAAQAEGVVGNENDAYGALVEQRAVCEGYARAFKLLCNKLGIECVNITGTAENRAHQWNCANIDGEWYHVDTTWNDSEGEWTKNDYFNLTDEQIEKDHTINRLFAEINNEEYDDNLSYNLYIPSCTSVTYNYYRQRGFILTDLKDDGGVVDALAQAAAKRENYFSIVIDGSLDFNKTFDTVINKGRFADWLQKANSKNSYSPAINSTCKVYRKDNIRVITAVLEYKSDKE